MQKLPFRFAAVPMVTLLSLCLLLLSGGAVRAQSPASSPAPVTILFVGNSFTHGKYPAIRDYNAAAVTDENVNLPADDPRGRKAASERGPFGGIAGIFKKFTDEAGLNYDVHLEVVSAKSLMFHYENGLSVIAQPKWNAVVLQGYSTEPLPSARGGKPETFLAYATKLEKAIHEANPATRIYLYQTFPRADLIYPEKAPYHGESVDAMCKDLHDGYQRAFNENGHFTSVARVGDAWLNAIRAEFAQANPYVPAEKPEQVNLWGTDHYHPSVHGAYLSALVLFQEITGVAARTLGAGELAARDLGISGGEAVYLQSIAETVYRTAPAIPEKKESAATPVPSVAP